MDGWVVACLILVNIILINYLDFSCVESCDLCGCSLFDDSGNPDPILRESEYEYWERPRTGPGAWQYFEYFILPSIQIIFILSLSAMKTNSYFLKELMNLIVKIEYKVKIQALSLFFTCSFSNIYLCPCSHFWRDLYGKRGRKGKNLFTVEYFSRACFEIFVMLKFENEKKIKWYGEILLCHEESYSTFFHTVLVYVE